MYSYCSQQSSVSLTGNFFLKKPRNTQQPRIIPAKTKEVRTYNCVACCVESQCFQIEMKMSVNCRNIYGKRFTLKPNAYAWMHTFEKKLHSRLTFYLIDSLVNYQHCWIWQTSFPARLRCSFVMVARTVAACSPPITDILAFGHINKKRGLRRENNKTHIDIQE